MPRFLLPILAIITLISCSPKKPGGFPAQITSQKTAQHRQIPGTRVFVVPPAGFNASAELPAFDNGGSGVIQAMDLEGGNYYTNAATFSREKFEASGVHVLDFRELKVNQYPAKMCLIQADSMTRVYNIVFGDSTFSTMVMGLYPTNNAALGAEVTKALQTVFYDKSLRIDALANAPFTLDETKSIFKFSKYTANMYLYSLGGTARDAGENEPYFFVMALPAEGVDLASIADEMLEKLQPVRIVGSSAAPVNGFTSLRREIYSTQDGQEALFYQHVVRVGNTVVLMQGGAPDNFQQNLAEFEKLSNTIGRRQ